MRLTDEQLKAGFLHPSRVVRGAIAAHFAESFSRDPDVTRWAIRGAEQYGWKDFLTWSHMFCDLPLVEDAAFEWVCQQVERTDAEAPDLALRWHLSAMLAKAEITFLVRQQSRLLAMDSMQAEDREIVMRRIELAETDPEECWRSLEEHCRRAATFETFKEANIPEATRLLEPLLKAGDRFVPRILEVLRRPQPEANSQHPDEWLIGLMIILAGQLRLEEAVSLIWDRWEADWDWYNEEVMYSLTRIGTPSVVQLARERYPKSEWSVRNYAHNLFENIRCEESIAALEELIPGEDDEFLRGQLGIAAAAQFDDRAAEIALRLWNENPEDGERRTIQEYLVAFSHLSEWKLPEREQWEQEILAADDRLRSGLPDSGEFLQRLMKAMASGLEGEDLFGPSLKEPAGYLNDLDREILDDKIPLYVPAGTPLRQASRTGRNDPCPCGSGKKFKKCCLNVSAPTNS